MGRSRRRRQPRAESRVRLTCGSLGQREEGSPQIISSNGGGGGGGNCCSWSNLPGDLLMSILLMLNPVDYSSFRGVCRGWRLASKDAEKVYMSSLPPLLLPRSAYGHNALYCFKDKSFLYVKQDIMIMQSDHVGVTGSQGNPLTSRRLDPGDRVLGFSHGYLIALDKDDETQLMLADALTGTVEDGIRFPPQDQPVEPRPYSFLMTSPPTSTDCLLVGMSSGTVLYCRPGDTRWKLHEFEREADGRSPVIRVDGTAAIGQKLYILTLTKYELFELELLQTSPRVTKVEAEGLPPFPMLFLPFLVECGGELLVVNAQFRGWMAYRLDRRARRWAQVHDLGGRAIALDNHSAGVSWQPTGNVWDEQGRDCIYYHKFPKVFVIRLSDGTQEARYLPQEGSCAGFQWIVPGLCASPIEYCQQLANSKLDPRRGMDDSVHSPTSRATEGPLP